MLSLCCMVRNSTGSTRQPTKSRTHDRLKPQQPAQSTQILVDTHKTPRLPTTGCTAHPTAWVLTAHKTAGSSSSQQGYSLHTQAFCRSKHLCDSAQHLNAGSDSLQSPCPRPPVGQTPFLMRTPSETRAAVSRAAHPWSALQLRTLEVQYSSLYRTRLQYGTAQ